MSVKSRPGSLSALSDDGLGTIAVSLAVAEVTWTPDVAPAVIDRIARDAVAYPDHFDRRPIHPGEMPAWRRGEASAGRSLVRVAILALVAALVLVVVYVVATTTPAGGGASDAGGLAIGLEPVADGLDGPIYVTSAGDGSDRLYVIEQAGRIRTVEPDGSVSADPFLDLSSEVVTSYEQGLLGLAFHPDFATNGRFYVDYTRAGDGATVISELVASAGVADPGSERQLLVIEQPFTNHNGGMLAFDADGYLLIGMGDGGGGGDPLGSGQDPGALLGKLLRIDVDGGEPYGIPPDNGYVDSAEHRPEIHAMGLRNPWRFSVDAEGGHIYIGDVGQGSWEEIDVLPDGSGGVDFGWNQLEGRECFVSGCDPDAHTSPAIVYGRDQGCTVVGGYAYRGTRQPTLVGRYIFGDYCSGRIWAAGAADLLEGAAEVVEVGRMDGTLVSFGVDEGGEIYAVDQGGRILHVVGEAG